MRTQVLFGVLLAVLALLAVLCGAQVIHLRYGGLAKARRRLSSLVDDFGNPRTPPARSFYPNMPLYRFPAPDTFLGYRSPYSGPGRTAWRDESLWAPYPNAIPPDRRY